MQPTRNNYQPGLHKIATLRVSVVCAAVMLVLRAVVKLSIK